jgi:hypothetical protein
VLKLGDAQPARRSSAVTHPSPLLTLLLALLVTACLPPVPIDDLVDTTSELPPDRCWGSYVKVARGRWQLESEFKGSSTTSIPGELAPAAFDITLSDWPSEHLLDMRLELTVSAGQALPGEALVLRRGSEPLQEVTLAGSHGNEAHFDVPLARDLCGTPCKLSLELLGAPTASDVPVPLKLSGKLFAFVDGTRETLPCAENELSVVVTDAL